MCVAKSWQALAGLRVLIGVGEALNSVAALYLTFLYKRNELATRGSLYYAMFALAGSMNGILSYGIVKNLNNARGWLAWRWLFLIEGNRSSLHPILTPDVSSLTLSRSHGRRVRSHCIFLSPIITRQTQKRVQHCRTTNCSSKIQ
jgi:MFS family permease